MTYSLKMNVQSLIQLLENLLHTAEILTQAQHLFRSRQPFRHIFQYIWNYSQKYTLQLTVLAAK